jgi:hypothetical protein
VVASNCSLISLFAVTELVFTTTVVAPAAIEAMPAVADPHDELATQFVVVL